MTNWSDYRSGYNSEGYYDPTASGAFDRIDRELADEDRVRKTVSALKNIAELAGFNITNRIELRDKATGRVYR